ncbi:unnamed protein product [Blepharisma stoltei]|uniref:ODAD1 central coiled coil region domain-containing protein n=1 Tax=Blepharisma stoltei TaxID=1481888 RepID=A0AAU9J0N4_9CILI|nr:unnamed protein product [Blepharisma stoltei]
MSNRSFMTGARTSMMVREPEIEILHKHIEEITEKLEKEKRESVYLDQQLEYFQDELSKTSCLNKTHFTSGPTEIQLKNKLQMLEKKLDLEITSLNDMRSQNRLIRHEVNVFRRDKRHYKRTLQSLDEGILNVSVVTQEKHEELTTKVNLASRNLNNIEKLRSKSLNNRSMYSQKLSELSTHIFDEKEREQKVHKRIEKGILGNLNSPGDTIEITKLLKELTSKWKEKLQEKRKILDNYVKHIMNIEDAFEEIRNASGIADFDEIVIALIKSEQQLYEICTYINNMNAEIDRLEEVHSETIEAIKSYGISLEFGLEKLNSLYESSKKKLNDLVEDKNGKIRQTENFRLSLESLQPYFKQVLERCKTSLADLEIAEEIRLDETTTLTEQNIFILLGELEEYLGHLQIFISRREDGAVDSSRLNRSSILLQDKSHEFKATSLRDLLELKDLHHDPEIEDVRYPISVQKLKSRAKRLAATTPNLEEMTRKSNQ